MSRKVSDYMARAAERQSREMAKVRGLWGRHVQRNAEEMRRAADLAFQLSQGPHTLLVLGYGEGNDVAAELLKDERFGSVHLVDIDGGAMESGLQRAGLSEQQGKRVRLHAADLSLLTPSFYAALDAALDGGGNLSDVRDALAELCRDALGADRETTFAPGLRALAELRPSLVVSTMLLTQIGYYLRSAIELVLVDRFELDLERQPPLVDFAPLQALMVELNARHVRLFEQLRGTAVGYFASDTGVLVGEQLANNPVKRADGSPYRPRAAEFVADTQAGLQGLVGAGSRQPGAPALATLARPLSPQSVYRPALAAPTLPELWAGIEGVDAGIASAAVWSWQLTKTRSLLVNALVVVDRGATPAARLILGDAHEELRAGDGAEQVEVQRVESLEGIRIDSGEQLAELLSARVDRQALPNREPLRELKTALRDDPDRVRDELHQRLRAAGDAGFGVAGDVLRELGVAEDAAAKLNKRGREKVAQLLLLLRRAQGDGGDEERQMAGWLATYRDYLESMDRAYDLKISSEGGAADPAEAQRALDAIEAARTPAEQALKALRRLDPSTVTAISELEQRIDAATVPLRSDPSRLVPVLRAVRALLREGIDLLAGRLRRLEQGT